MVLISCSPFFIFFFSLLVAFTSPESQEEAWVSVVLFEYRNVESLGIDTSDGSGYPIVSDFYEKSYFFVRY
jgi:predicted permease